MPVTMKDIADKAGVARSTVSAVLNNKTYTRISDSKREKILNISRELNYRRNFAATALKERRTGLLGLICGNLQNQFHSELTMAMAETVAMHGYELMLAVMPADNHFDMQYFDRMLTDMCDGIFMCRDLRGDDNEVMNRLKEKPVPFVFLESAPEGFSAVKYDKQFGMELAFEEFIAKGHRRIAYTNRARDFDKLDAYINCCRKYGIETRIRELPLEADLEEAFEFGRTVARNHDEYSALILTEYNLELIIGGFDAEGIRIPEDLSVIAFNDTQRSRTFRPPLTAVSLNMKMLSRYAMDIMIGQIKNFDPTKTKSVLIPPQIIRRESVKKID